MYLYFIGTYRGAEYCNDYHIVIKRSAVPKIIEL